MLVLVARHHHEQALEIPRIGFSVFKDRTVSPQLNEEVGPDLVVVEKLWRPFIRAQGLGFPLGE